MYHIPNDRRALCSADRLYQGLMECLKTERLTDVTVIETVRRSGVGRSTFYRLFDTVVDILVWHCERMIQEGIRRAELADDRSMRTSFLFFASAWTEHRRLLEALLENERMDILYSAHGKYMSEISGIFLTEHHMNPEQEAYLSALMVAIIPAVFQVWIQHPEYRAEDLYDRLRDGIGMLQVLFS